MLIWDKAKKGTFTGEERETLICSNNEGTTDLKFCESDYILGLLLTINFV